MNLGIFPPDFWRLKVSPLKKFGEVSPVKETLYEREREKA
jgi:hypothetical protein